MMLNLLIDDMKPISQQRMINRKQIDSMRNSSNLTSKENSIQPTQSKETKIQSSGIDLAKSLYVDQLHFPQQSQIVPQQMMQSTVIATKYQKEWFQFTELFPLTTQKQLIVLKAILSIGIITFTVSYILAFFSFNHHPTAYILYILLTSFGFFLFLIQIRLNLVIRYAFYEQYFFLQIAPSSFILLILSFLQPINFTTPLYTASSSLCIISIFVFGTITAWFCVQYIRLLHKQRSFT